MRADCPNAVEAALLVFTRGMIVLGCVVLLGMLLAFPMRWLWNDLMPALFHLRRISWCEAWQLQILISLLGPRSTKMLLSSSSSSSTSITS